VAESAASLVGLAVLGDAEAESLETTGTVGSGSNEVSIGD
jgi:hypothetical protein